MWSHYLNSSNISLKAITSALSSWDNLFPLQPGWELSRYPVSWPCLSSPGVGAGSEAAWEPSSPRKAGTLGTTSGTGKTDKQSLPDSILPSFFSWASSEPLEPLEKGWWLKRSSHRRLRHSLARKRRTYPTLFTTGRLLRCCFPSKDAETGKPQRQPLRVGHKKATGPWEEVFVCAVVPWF